MRTLTHDRACGRTATRCVATAVVALAAFGTTATAQANTARAAATSPEARTGGSAPRDVTIPFTVGPATCVDRTRLHAVSIRIYNVLAQIVAVPTLQPESGAEPPPVGTIGRLLNRVMLPCGRYAARWTGRHMSTGRQLPAGVYLYELVVDDQRVARKLTLGK